MWYTLTVMLLYLCLMLLILLQVLDEADRMLDLGFEPAVRAILSQTCSGMNNALYVWFHHLNS